MSDKLNPTSVRDVISLFTREGANTSSSTPSNSMISQFSDILMDQKGSFTLIGDHGNTQHNGTFSSLPRDGGSAQTADELISQGKI